MSGNPTLFEVKDYGWLNGFGSLLRKENHNLWGKWQWLVQILIWIAIIDGLLAMVAFTETTGPEKDFAQTVLMSFFVFAGIIPIFGVIILGQEAILDERKMGTAAWVLSKPVSRAAFLLSKLFSHALRVLTTMVLVQGCIAYFILKFEVGIPLSIPGFLAGIGLVYLNLIFFLALIMMLGALFHSRGPVIGIPMATISCSYLGVLVPWLEEFIPLNLVMSFAEGRTSLAASLALGQPLPTVIPIVSTGLMIILFITIALARFEREEF